MRHPTWEAVTHLLRTGHGAVANENLLLVLDALSDLNEQIYDHAPPEAVKEHVERVKYALDIVATEYRT